MALAEAVVYRASYYKAVAFLEFRGDFIHDIIEHAFSQLPASAAGDAAPDVFHADLDSLRLDALCGQKVFSISCKSDGSVALWTGGFRLSVRLSW